MSVKFTGQKQYSTTSNTLTTGQSRFTISFFYRFDGDPSVASNYFLFHRNYYSGPWGLIKYLGKGKNTVNFAFPLSSGARPNVDIDFEVGAVYYVALVFDQGIQRAYINAVPRTMGTATEVTGAGSGSRVPFSIGGCLGTGRPEVSYTIGSFEIAEGYALTQDGAIAIRDGRSSLFDLATIATRRVRWTLEGQDDGVATRAMAVVTPGAGGLLDSAGSLHLVSVSGTGSASYVPRLDWSPSAKSFPYIPTSGQWLGCRFSGKTTGAKTIPTMLNVIPTLKINGVDVGPLWRPYVPGYQWTSLISLPEGVTVKPEDVVTASAPDGWMTTNFGLAEGFSDAPVKNLAGRSSHGSDEIERTLRIGVNVTPSSISTENFQVAKNRAKTHDRFSNATHDSQGYPIFTPSATHMAAIMFCPDDNPVDATGYPGPLGLHAIGWSEKDPSNQGNFDFSEQDGYRTFDENFASVERLDLSNPGRIVDGKLVGKVRVFDIQKQPNAPKARRLVRLRLTSPPNKRPSYEDLDIRGPKDFTYQDGVPVVLDKSNPLGATNVLLDRLNGVGSVRAAEATIENMGSCSMCEPEHLTNGDDYRWGRYSFSRRVGIKQARPYDAAKSPYVYHLTEGSKYPVTLAARINAEQTTLQIAYDEANPVFAHLRLFIGSEIVRIDSIASGTLATGNTVTFNVSRGMASSSGAATVPASHAAGTIQAGYRFAFTALGMAGGNGNIMELVSDGPHNVWSGFNINWQGTWPTFTFEGGEQVNARQGRMIGWMTGPDRMCIGFGTQSAGVHNLSTTYDLNPTNCYAQCSVPHGGATLTPYEVLATMAGQLEDCDLFLNLPYAGTDDLYAEIARRIRDNYPAGRRIDLELALEAWNWYFTGFPVFSVLNRMLTGDPDVYPLLIKHTGRAKAIFRRVFGEHGRADEIRCLINVNSMAIGGITNILDMGRSQNPPVEIDDIATAPYISPASYAGDTETVIAMNRATTEQCIDLYTHCLIENASIDTGSYPEILKAQSARIAAYNAANGTRCELLGYEGGKEVLIPRYKVGTGSVSAINGSPAVVGTGTNFLKMFRAGDTIAISNVNYTIQVVTDDTHLTLATNYAGATGASLGWKLMVTNRDEKAYDMVFHPNWYIAEHDFYAMCQKGGYTRMNLFKYSGVYHYQAGVAIGYFQWSIWNHLYQESGRGDGSDGKKDNRRTVCMPGQPNTKLPTQNLFEENVSVCGQALKDWNREVYRNKRSNVIHVSSDSFDGAKL